MLMGGDYDLNSSQVHTGSLKEILRQTILNQEVIFRKQVHELHRLYTTQRTLMKDCGRKLANARTQSTLRPFSEQLGCEPLATEKTYPTIFKVGSAQSVWSNSLQEGRGICPKLQQRPLDLQPLSSNCINYIGGDFSVAGNNWDYIGKSNGRNHYFHGDSVYRPEEVKLSLSIGEGSTKEGVGRKPLTDNISCVFSQEIIDLEESTEMVSNDDGQSVFSLRCCDRINSGHNKHDYQVPAQSIQNVTDILVKDPSDEFTMIDSSIGSNGICHEQNFSMKGLNECYDNVPRDNTFTKGKLFTSNVVIDLDLNKIQLDESSSHSNDPMLAYPSAASSSGDAILGSTDSNSNNNNGNELATIPKSKADDGNKTCSIDLESMSEFRSGLSEDTGDHSRNMDIRSNLQSGSYIDIPRPEVNGGKVNEDISLALPYRSQSAIGDAHCNGCPASCKCNCIADDNPSITKTIQSGTDLVGGSCLCPSSMIRNIESSQVAETACQPDLRSSGNNEMKHQSSDKKKGKSVEIYCLVQNAAASLICISLENPISNHDFTTKSGSNEIGVNEREQPVCSSDSYESMVLRLTETSADDYCVSSNAFEVNELDKKDSPIKLRRGRRLKDFQKDILPGLASLARHEICEDINIMEGVMRSREYKRLRSKAANGGNWFTPVRSRRSRLNYVSRRYYS